MSSSSPEHSSPSNSPPRAGLGANFGGNVSPPPSPSPSSSSASSGSSTAQCDNSGLPSTFGGAKSRKRRRTRPVPSVKPFPQPKDEAPGAWEKHTKGMASKYMAKYGFSGRLGARSDGISQPVQAVVRPSKLGLGAGGFVERKTEEEKTERADAKTVQWRKKGVKRMRESIEKVEEVEMKEEIGRERFVKPEIGWEVGMLRDRARGELEERKRRRGTEKLIMDTTLGEAKRIASERKNAEEVVEMLGRLEMGLQRLEKGEEELGHIVRELRGICERAGEYVGRKRLGEIFLNGVEGRLEELFAACFVKGGGGRRRRAQGVSKVLGGVRAIVGEELYLRLCVRVVLRRLRIVLGGDWDCVEGAWAGDVVGEMSGVVGGEVLSVFAEDILVPKLLQGIGRGDWHVWVFPWLPVVGRKRLGEVLGRVRVEVGKMLQRDEEGVLETVKMWKGVLSGSKLQMMLARHVVDKLAVEIEHGEAEGLRRVREWGSVVKGSVLERGLRSGLVGMCAVMREVVLREGWQRGVRLYRKWKEELGDSAKELRGGLAAILFIIHAGRVGAGSAIMGGDLEELLKNGFGRGEAKEKGRKEEKMELKDLVLELARREGLPVVGLGGGMLKVGNVQVRVDKRRGLVVGDRVVGASEMLMLARR